MTYRTSDGKGGGDSVKKDLSNVSQNEIPYKDVDSLKGSSIFNVDGKTVFKTQVEVESNVLGLGGSQITGSGRAIGYKNNIDGTRGRLVTHKQDDNGKAISPSILFPTSIQLIPVSTVETFQMPDKINYTIQATVSESSFDTDFEITEIRLKLYQATQNLKIRISDNNGKIIRSLPSEYSFIDGTGISLASGEQVIVLNAPITLKNNEILNIDIESANGCLLGDQATGIPYNSIKVTILSETDLSTALIPEGLIYESDNNAVLKPNREYRLSHNTDNAVFNLSLEDGYAINNTIVINRCIGLGGNGRVIQFSHPKMTIMVNGSNTIVDLNGSFTISDHQRIIFKWAGSDLGWEVLV